MLAVLLFAMAGSAPGNSLRVDGSRLIVESAKFTASFNGAALESVRHRNGTEFCRPEAAQAPLEIVYLNKDTLGQGKHQKVEVRQISNLAARIVLAADDSDRELLVRLDEATGDVCVTPGGRGARRGVLAVRWNVAFAREDALVLPSINGLLVEAGREFPRSNRFPWPYLWNAQLAIAMRDGVSLMIHAQDTAAKFKALNLARKDGLTTLGFDSEQTGPVWDNQAAGGLEWRINVYDGDWRTPATRYREWMARAYSLAEKRAARPAWVNDIDFSVGWANADTRLLPALARIHPPSKTLIHLATWRTSKYDVDYPDYFATPAAKAFMEEAGRLGFHVMPHFNYFACFLKHPVYQHVRDWQIRSVGRNEPEGWYWPPETFDYTRMGYIHPGLGLWRRTLIDAVLEACRALKAPIAFLDQTLCTWNTDNGLVENMTTVEGLRKLQEEFAAIEPGLVLAGEGLNEISIQRQAFAQAHILEGRPDLRPEHIAAAHPLGAFLWSGHTRLLGYYHLNPKDKDVDIGIEVYRRMGAIPTLITNDVDRITADEPVVRKLIEQVRSK